MLVIVYALHAARTQRERERERERSLEMVYSCRTLANSIPTTLTLVFPRKQQLFRIVRVTLKSNFRWRSMASEPDASPPSSSADKNAAGFCIIEGPENEQGFAKMGLEEIHDGIRSRRNKIFLHMEEVRRLRIQQRIRSAELGILKEETENNLPNFPSFIPFLPPLSAANLKVYYATCFSMIAGIIIFGGLVAPVLELRLGLGGTSYEDFIRSMHLPLQLRTAGCDQDDDCFLQTARK